MKLQDILLVVIIALLLFLGFSVYQQMPDQEVPMHWNEFGQVDGYGPAWTLLLIPVITGLIYLLFLVIPKIAVKKKNFQASIEYYDQIKVIMVLLMSYLYLITLLPLSGYNFNMSWAIFPAIAAMLFYFGLIMPRFKQNYFVGIRTPWALADKRVWKKTQERGGKVFMLMAVGIFLAGMLPEHFGPIFIVTLVGGLLYIFYYSYSVWRNFHR